jgi:DNA helicase II / ATP-dependent DNA helicase PcrA
VAASRTALAWSPTGDLTPSGSPDAAPEHTPSPESAPESESALEPASALERVRLASLEHPAVRDVLAWLRLLVDPHDAAAVVRALTRPPIELRQVELARVIQIARRRSPFGGARKLDLVHGLAAATESPQVPPEARDRIQRFLELHASVAANFAAQSPQAFLAQLVERIHTERQPLLGAARDEAHGDGLDELQRLAGEFLLSAPRARTRELAVYLAEALPGARRRAPSPVRSSAPANEQPTAADPIAHEPPDGREQAERELHATLQMLRDELLGDVSQIGGRLGELRLDTELDVAHGVVRYLELLKLSTLAQRPAGQSLEQALADVNARLQAAATPLQREILQTSSLDHTLLARTQPGEAGEDAALARQHARARSLAPREQHSLVPFLPRKGSGLALSASDIFTYRSCPLRYKYARVLRIPVEQTLPQRFGIVVHQTLERYHSDDRASSLEHMLLLLDGCWKRAGLGEGDDHGELRRKAVKALTRYHARLALQESEPVWFERAFSFRIGPHHLRGRVDRVDRLGKGEGAGEGAQYELIDYKTSRPKGPHELSQDVQLSLYALAAREDWGLSSTQQAYYYVLDDLIVPVPEAAQDAQSLESVVLEVGDGILAQEFEPTPSPTACSMCDYRIVCPAAVG